MFQYKIVAASATNVDAGMKKIDAGGRIFLCGLIQYTLIEQSDNWNYTLYWEKQLWNTLY